MPTESTDRYRGCPKIRSFRCACAVCPAFMRKAMLGRYLAYGCGLLQPGSWHFASAVRHGHSSEPGSLVTSRHGLLRGLRPGSNGQKVVAPEVYTRNASAESWTFKQSKQRCVELSSQRVANNQDAIRRPRLSCAKNIQCIAQR